MPPHFRSDHDAVTMVSFIIILVIAYCSGTHGDIFPIVTRNPKDIKLTQKGNNDTIENGIFWKNLALPRNKSTKIEESMSSVSAHDTTKRKSRLLGSLGFLAGLNFGNLANAASSTVKTFSSLPQASLTLNLGSSSRNSPYFAAYYNPYSLLPYSFLYPGAFGLVPAFDHAKPQTASNNALIPQVISLFNNRQPIDLVLNNEEYIEEKKKSDHNKKTGGSEDEDRRAELRVGADRNAEEKTKVHGCKESQRKQGSFFKGSLREDEKLQEDADDSGATLNFQATNMTDMSMNETRKHHTTTPTPTVTPSSHITPPPPMYNTTHNIGNYTDYPPFLGYYGGYPQDINHIELKPDSDTYQYHGHNYNLPYERPPSFYHDNKYNTYSSPHVNPYFSGSFSSDQTNEYVGTDFNRLYGQEYQPPYVNGFRPVK